MLGRMVIANRGDGEDPARGDYDVRVGRKSKLEPAEVYHHPQRSGEVLNYPRLSYSVWRLVLRALRATFPEEAA